jgi:hypothetical protein
MEGKGRESHRGCLLPRVDKQEMGRCGSQAARGGGERPSGGAGWGGLGDTSPRPRVCQGACRHGSRDGEPASGH